MSAELKGLAAAAEAVRLANDNLRPVVVRREPVGSEGQRAVDTVGRVADELRGLVQVLRAQAEQERAALYARHDRALRALAEEVNAEEGAGDGDRVM